MLTFTSRKNVLHDNIKFLQVTHSNELLSHGWSLCCNAAANVCMMIGIWWRILEKRLYNSIWLNPFGYYCTRKVQYEWKLVEKVNEWDFFIWNMAWTFSELVIFLAWLRWRDEIAVYTFFSAKKDIHYICIMDSLGWSREKRIERK